MQPVEIIEILLVKKYILTFWKMNIILRLTLMLNVVWLSEPLKSCLERYSLL
jgi:hypothetical protein